MPKACMRFRVTVDSNRARLRNNRTAMLDEKIFDTARFWACTDDVRSPHFEMITLTAWRGNKHAAAQFRQINRCAEPVLESIRRGCATLLLGKVEDFCHRQPFLARRGMGQRLLERPHQAFPF